MNWLGLIQTALGAIAAVIGYLKERELIDGAVASALNVHLKGALDEISRANAARDAVRVDALKHPDRLHDDDGFRRD